MSFLPSLGRGGGGLLFFLDSAHAQCAEEEGNTGHNHHVALYAAYKSQQRATDGGSDDLRDADSAVAQAQPMSRNGMNSRY